MIRGVRLKVCGMRDKSNILAVARLKPDYMGFIFYRKSKRFVGAGFTLPVDFPSDVQKVGVFVNEPVVNILEWVKKLPLDLVQLHGDEPPADCRELKTVGVKVIKVFSIGNEFDFGALDPYKKVVDYFMFDTKGPDYGGTGTRFDWKILEKYDQSIPFFLGGGLSSSNVERVSMLKGMNLHAVDVNSGVEVEPGLKDVAMVKQLMRTLEQCLN